MSGELTVTVVGVDTGSENDYTVVTSCANTGTGGAVGANGGWVVMPTVTTVPSATWTGTSASTWATTTPTWQPITLRAACRFCSNDLEMGITIQNKKGEQHHVCLKCLKEIMTNEKVKELMDLIEPLAVMVELAKQ